MKQEKKQGIISIIHALGELPDEMIAEAALDKGSLTGTASLALDHKKEHHSRRRFRNALGFASLAACTALVLIGLTTLRPSPDKPAEEKQTLSSTEENKKSQATPGQKTSVSYLTVTAYAQEHIEGNHGENQTAKKRGDEDSKAERSYRSVQLNEKMTVLMAEYTPAMSCVPAMPFSCDYSGTEENVVIEVSRKDQGKLQIWDVSDGGYWKLKEEGNTLTVMPGEKIYWQPPGKPKKTNRLSMKAFAGETLLEERIVKITCRDGYYTASLRQP